MPPGLGQDATFDVEAIRSLAREHGGPLDRRGAYLEQHVAWLAAGGGHDSSPLDQSEHLTDHDRTVDRRCHLSVAADERRPHLGQGPWDRREEVAHHALDGARRHEHHSQEPLRPRPADGDVVRVHHDRQQRDVLRREGDRIGGHDKRAARDVDRGRVLADACAESNLGRKRRQLCEQAREELVRQLPALERTRAIRRIAHGSAGYGVRILGACPARP